MRLSSRRNSFAIGKRSRQAFSLVELLLAVAIVAFLVLILAQIISSAEGIWRHSAARVDAFRDARAALELMSRELTVALTNDRAPVLALENIFTQPNDAAAGPANNQQVYALLPLRNVGDPGGSRTNERTDICAVGFYCSWNADRHAYVLRKHILQSNPTYARLRAAFGNPTPTPSPSPAPPGAPITPDAIFSPTDPTTNPAEDEDVAAYVWDLKITAYELVGGVPAPQTYPAVYRSTLPQFIDVSFKAISQQAARQLEAQNVDPKTWFDTGGTIYRNQILPQLHQFSTRIYFQNAPKP